VQLHALLEGAVPSVLLLEGAANWHLLSKHPCSYIGQAIAERKTIPCRPLVDYPRTTMTKPSKTVGSFAYDMNAGCSSPTVRGSYVRANVDISAPSPSDACKTYQQVGHSHKAGAILKT